jgi:hypothetical protein
LEAFVHPAVKSEHIVFEEDGGYSMLKEKSNGKDKDIMNLFGNGEGECSEDIFSEENDDNNEDGHDENAENTTVKTSSSVKRDLELHQERCKKAEENICILKNHLLAMVCFLFIFYSVVVFYLFSILLWL